MPRETFQLTGGAAAIYEQQKVKAIFRPLAEATLPLVNISKADSVLDVACGTGIVARTVQDRIAPLLPVTGTDLNADMIATARELTKDRSDAFQWHVADVTGMPFPDGIFTLAVCQQGLQFFPDEGAALQEIRRVLRFAGQFVLSVWAGPSRFFEALAAALARHVSEETAERSLAPFTYARLNSIPRMLQSAGFDDVTTRDLTIDRVIEQAEEAIPREIMASPVGPTVAALGPDVMARIVADVLEACADLRQGGDLISAQTARIFSATAL